MSIARSRVVDLMRVQCRIFNTTFNPNRLRIGTKILRQRLRGAALASYYPPRVGTIQQLRKDFPRAVIEDEEEQDRLEHIERLKARGKGAPKKKRTAAGMS
ncbi:hypothetical protein P152DRAFT_402658 [Eremomyces bilateralis CBS 781.70]|uniref:Small ribosomal subunit protein mS33 n=1 Tax=Eremomyces bilateralis CBS 781.70 TaxID=1392243 RepID=A0A6G1FVV7_9PEZI|nr:uncharacterized protein P152DRAFT_402658 [Eremomyces bilateralis CBS 781.70]KAF1809836.1 hypothetical protein P152DRAFT_402658 [Eremomyces bilateralis CBS 781.70]